MLTDINESCLDVYPHVGLDLPPYSPTSSLSTAPSSRDRLPVLYCSYRTALIPLIGDSLSRKTKDLLVGVSTVSYKTVSQNGER